MIKKSVIILLCVASVLSICQVGYAEQNRTFDLTVVDQGKIIFQKRYQKNPEFFFATSISIEQRAKAYGSHFGNVEFCDYIFGSLGSDVADLFHKIQDIQPSDCIVFDKKDFSFVYDIQKSTWKIDRSSFFDALYSNMSEQSVTITLKREKREPLYTEVDLERLTEKIGEYQTDYTNSVQNRKKNIKVAAGRLSGIVVGVGETFSFNKIVGKRRKENGFYDATVIQSGEYTQGVGGGVCQVATTLYNALLFAGFEQISCAHHSLAPSYVPLSFDAMVSEWVDLKMRNTTGAPVYIGMSANGQKLKAVVFGKKGEESYRFESEIVETLVHKDAEKDIESVYKNGYKSRGYKLIYKNGKLIKKVLIRQDEYKPYKVNQN